MTQPKTAISTAMMFYMSAQNELSARAEDDIDEIKAAGDISDLALYIMLDTLDDTTGPGKRETRVWQIPGGSARGAIGEPEIRPDADAVDNRVFSRFLGEAETEFRTYTNKQKILVLWGHGGGMVMLDQERAPGQVRSQATVVDFAEALERRARAPADAMRFDMIAFDSCYMGVIETMHQFRGISDYALVSSTIVDASGYPYTPIITNLQQQGKDLVPLAAARMICKVYNDHYQQMGKLKRRYLFCCDTAKAGSCVHALNNLGKLLSSLFQTKADADPVRAALAEALFLAHETDSYVGILIFLTKLLGCMEAVIPEADFARLKTDTDALDAAVRDAFTGPLGDTGSIPTSPLIWAPVNAGEFNSNVVAYARLDASSSGSGGWISMWRQYHVAPPLHMPSVAIRSKFESSVRPASLLHGAAPRRAPRP